MPIKLDFLLMRYLCDWRGRSPFAHPLAMVDMPERYEAALSGGDRNEF